jgi:prolyl oligopeptidase
MKKTILMLAIPVLFFSCGEDSQQAHTSQEGYKHIDVEYPDTYEDTTVVEDYFGTLIRDPYRWLEDDNSASTLRWVKQQQSLTENYLSHIPYRSAIQQRLEKLWNYERYDIPQKRGDYFYLFKNDGLQNQDVLYRMPALDGQMEEVLNPNRFAGSGTTSLGEISFSGDGSLLAYQVSVAGSDWKQIYVKDLESGQTLRDTISWVKFSGISWYQDGFFYSRYPAPPEGEELAGKNEFHQLYYHRVGTSQEEDLLIFADRQFPQRNVQAQTTENEHFLTLSTSQSTSGNALYFRDLRTNELAFSPIVENFDNDYTVVGSSGNDLFILTNYKAPNNRLLKVNTQRLAEQYWEEVLPESENSLQEVELAGDYILAHYLRDAFSELKVYKRDGSLEKTIKLPGYGTILDISSSKDHNTVYIKYTTFLQPETVYILSMNDFKLDVFRRPEVDFNSGDYEVKQVKYTSYDGTEVPMFIIHKKGLRLNGEHPTLLYGYGGFNISYTPQFNRTRVMLFPVILENGGVCAVANIRGGGEYGTDWHQAGTKQNKQNVFDDFQAAAEYLIANQYTRPDKLAIHGRSNGGLLVGACMVQRPDLFKVAIPSVGVLDMLRYHKFTIGWAWETDYGRSDEQEAFEYLNAYSPLHNVQSTAYPATMITTADHDDRVVPAHSYKFAATLQAKQKGENPVLIRIDSSSGHGAGKPTAKRIEEGADILSFMFHNMKSSVHYPTEN